MIRFVVTLAAVLAGTLAMAQAERVRKKTILDLDEVVIEGVRWLPGSTAVVGKARPKFKSLVPIRANFVPELQRSTDNL